MAAPSFNPAGYFFLIRLPIDYHLPLSLALSLLRTWMDRPCIRAGEAPPALISTGRDATR